METSFNLPYHIVDIFSHGDCELFMNSLYAKLPNATKYAVQEYEDMVDHFIVECKGKFIDVRGIFDSFESLAKAPDYVFDISRGPGSKCEATYPYLNHKLSDSFLATLPCDILAYVQEFADWVVDLLIKEGKLQQFFE